MKKSIVILITAFILLGLLYAEDRINMQSQVVDRGPNVTDHSHGIPVTRELFDFQFSYPVDDGEAGVECDGNYIYTSEWWSESFNKYELDGTYVGEFTIPGATYIRDLAYDGQYFYGSAADNTVFQMDFNSQTVVGIINAPIDVRAIAYDEGEDGFWANNWSDDITLFDRSGNILDSFPCQTFSLYYGFAYDNILPGGPYLWGYAQDGPSSNQLVQFDIATGLETGVNIDINSITPCLSMAGGLCITDGIIPGKWIIAGNCQSELIWGLELADSVLPETPAAPADVAVIPDAGGALSANIDWVCPTLQANGDPLTELLEMRVYRGTDIIYTDTNPVIGGPGNHTDGVVPAHGTYSYKVVGYNSFGEGIYVVETVYVGEDVPNVVENLLLEQTAPDVLSGTLTWINPVAGLNGGAFNETILGYHIVRSDGVTFEHTGIATEYIDNTIPVTDNYFYTVQAYNSIGDGATEISNNAFIADANLLLMEDFSDGVIPAGWSVIGVGEVNWSIQESNYTGGWGVASEARFNWTPQCIGVSRFTTHPIDTSGMVGLSLEFKHLLLPWGGPYTLSVTTTSDGIAWNPTAFSIVNPSNTVGPETQIITIANPDVGSPTFQLAFTFDGDSDNLTQWNIDDVILSDGGNNGWIEGVVALDGGTGNVEDIEVTASGVTVNPDTDGNYVIPITSGTHDVTASLTGYENDTVMGVVVEEGIITPNINLTLVYIPPVLDPPINLAVECIDNYAHFTWNGGILYELTQHDGNPLNTHNQYLGYGYGVVYDLTGYTNVTIEMLDYRHISWNVFGIWDYKIHIVDWDTYTELASTDILQTTGDDQWEEGIDLGSISEDGLVGIFLEPLSNNPSNVYPCFAGDGPTDGMSCYGDLNSYWTFSTSNVGDFLMNLWIMADGTRQLVKAKVLPAKLIKNKNTHLTTNEVEFVSLQHTKNNRDLLSYDVYLDGQFKGNTTLEEYQFFDLINGEFYDAGVKAIYDDGTSELAEINFQYTGITGVENILPFINKLNGNYPNPFNPVTTISFSVTQTSQFVTLEVFNLKGQKVKTLIDEKMPAGNHQVVWDGKNKNSKSVSSGIYFYKMNTGEFSSIRKMILMK